MEFTTKKQRRINPQITQITQIFVTTQLLLFQTHFESANYSKSVSKVKGNREEIKGKREKAGKRGKRNI
ncbi:MAG: hypothetical protein ABH886_00695, partial [Candidatus Desantisbacteria bacterium]